MKKLTLLLLMAAGVNGLCADSEVEPSKAYQELWNQPEISRRIDDGIRTNRMGEVVLKFTTADALPLTNVTVKVEQTRQEFLFGANLFMLGCFPTPEENRRYEAAFTSIFNYATVPFYWSDLEPEPGKLRFAKNSLPIYRRPPPDAVVEFCRQHGIEMKGHPLVWHSYYPKWRPDDPLEAMVRTEQHITEIASRYGESIKRWEVVNEPCERRTWEVKWCNLPEDYVFRSFDTAAKCFPAGDRLMINEAPTFSWVEFYGTESRYYRLIRELLGRGARVMYYNTNAVADEFTYTVSDGFGGTNSATVAINVDSTPLFGQATIPAVDTTSGTATLNFAGIPTYSYSVMRSTNLTAWAAIWTTNAPAGGVFQYIDNPAPTPSAYYRLQFNP